MEVRLAIPNARDGEASKTCTVELHLAVSDTSNTVVGPSGISGTLRRGASGIPGLQDLWVFPSLQYFLVAYSPKLHIDPAVYPNFDIYPSVQGDRPDRSHAPNTVPETTAIQMQGRTLSTYSSASKTGSSLKADRVGYPALNICMYSLPPWSACILLLSFLHDPTF